MSYETFEQKMAALETFDPKVFRGDDEVPQEVCDLVLSLSMAYNDFRDAFFAELLLLELNVKPDDPVSIRLGLRNGLNNTVVRVRTGFVHELMNLIGDSEKAIANQAFVSIVKKLSKRGKVAWSALKDAATQKHSTDELAKALVIIRNKVSFHYDSKEIGRGYETAFFYEQDIYRAKPFVSRGSRLVETRFYFADAASQAYIRKRALGTIVSDFLDGQGQLLDAINHALYEIVTKFIQSRSPWEKHR